MVSKRKVSKRKVSKRMINKLLLGKLLPRSFRQTVLLLVWAAVAVPLLILCVYQVRADYLRQQVIHEQELTYETERLSLLLTQNILQLMGDLDRIASDGSVIRSLSMPILTPISVQKIEAFLGNNPSTHSVMLIDKEFFPIEVIPTWALTDDVSVYEPYMAEVVSSPASISDPRPRMFVPPGLPGQAQKLIFIRPILTASASLSQPFQVDGLLLVAIDIEKLIQALIDQHSNNPELLRLLNGEQVLYAREASGEPLYVHRASIILGLDNQSLALELGRSIEGVLSEVLLAYRTQAIAVALFIGLMLLVVKTLADKLVRPLQLLSELTTAMSNNNFQQRRDISLNSQAMQYREFSEAFALLADMERLISEQFQQLHEANATLEDKVAERTEALEANIQLLNQQRGALQRLVRYSMDVHQINELDELGQMSLALAQDIGHQPFGLYLLRGEFFHGCQLWSTLNEQLQMFLQQHHSHLNDYVSLMQLMQSQTELQCFAVGSSSATYQGFLLTVRSAQSEQASEALMVLSTMLASALRQHNLNAKLHQLAHVDSVTGLSNRHLFNARLKDKIAHFDPSEQSSKFGIFVIDVNGLKFINDHYGHNYGDAMLTTIAHALKHAARADDTVARVGGDEFYIILEQASAETCATFAERLNKLNSNLTMTIEQQSMAISFSYGSASTDQDALKNLLALADERMYSAKKKHYQRLSDA
jgi:diguanylate cyclase (GGDEF)-like protein